uniref:Retrotransposon Copia-like N-terminal domain-containing protein n=1 Tax=Chenopodium quinoa TaxID=63459 RepID=A0A803LYH2_CHEQI
MPTTTMDPISPIYLHLSDGQALFVGIEKLHGPSNFRSWKRPMDIALSAKRKYGFVTGTLKKYLDDDVKSKAWDTCNSMVISWILGSVSDSIKQSIMFVNSFTRCGQNWKGDFLSQMGLGNTNLIKICMRPNNMEKGFVSIIQE